MAHHQGMSFLSLSYLLLDRPMQKRFESDPAFQATMLLLQERIPKATRTYPHSAELSNEKKSSSTREPSLRVFSSPNTPVPQVQLLRTAVIMAGHQCRWRVQPLENIVYALARSSTRDKGEHSAISAM
jgi:hypothetical protein